MIIAVSVGSISSKPSWDSTTSTISKIGPELGDSIAMLIQSPAGASSANVSISGMKAMNSPAMIEPQLWPV